LFERLVDLDPSLAWEPQPFRVFDRAGLEESVRRAASRILNTRSHITARLQEYVRGTVLDFGIPDTTAYSPASEPDRLALGELIAASLARHEPRLRNVHVRLEPHPSNPRAMIGELRASLLVDSTEQPVSFPLSIDSQGADTGAGETSSTGPESPGATPDR
jgi:type VI secretion system protein ImpF